MKFLSHPNCVFAGLLVLICFMFLADFWMGVCGQVMAVLTVLISIDDDEEETDEDEEC